MGGRDRPRGQERPVTHVADRSGEAAAKPHHEILNKREPPSLLVAAIDGNASVPVPTKP